MKIELNDVTNIDSVNTINSNFDKIVNELQDKVLYRSNPEGEPNTVESNIDMNGFDIINVKDVYSSNGRWATIDEMLSLNAQALTSKNQARGYASAAMGYMDQAGDYAFEALGHALGSNSIYDQFNNTFLGNKSADPSTDNQGNTLLAGTMYFNNTAPQVMRIYNGSAWQDVGSIATTTTNTVDPVLFASTLEAEQGIGTSKVMSPARVKDAIDSQVKGGFTATGPIILSSDASNSLEAVTLQQVLQLVSASVLPSGAVQPFAMDTAPTGWLAANGQAVSRTTFSSLFAAIGTRFGSGDGSTTFNLPDLRSEFIRGWDNGRGIDAGRVIGSWQASELGSHAHASGSEALYADYGGGSFVNGSRTLATGSLPSYRNALTSTVGGNETRPRNIAMLYCIKT